MRATASPAAIRAPMAPLTADDRCDRCGAQAYVQVELASSGVLLFCGHHARKYGPRLRELAVAVNDETASLDR